MSRVFQDFYLLGKWKLCLPRIHISHFQGLHLCHPLDFCTFIITNIFKFVKDILKFLLKLLKPYQSETQSISAVVLFLPCFLDKFKSTCYLLYIYYNRFFKKCQGVFLFFFEISYYLLSWSRTPRKCLGYLSPWQL